MKGYLKLIITAMIIFVTIVVFYVQTSADLVGKAEFNIKDDRGDEAVIEGIEIQGAIEYIVEDAYDYGALISWEDFTIANEQSTFKNRATIGGPSMYFSSENRVEKSVLTLQKNYRNYMRGKIAVPNYYYEDAERLIYTEINSKSNQAINSENPNHIYELTVDILLKDSKKREKFTTVLPQTKDVYYAEIEEVQWIDGQVFLTVKQPKEYKKDGLYFYEEEYVLYHIDVNKKEIKDKMELFTLELADDDPVSTYMLEKSNPLGASAYRMIFSEKYHEISNGTDDDEVYERIIDKREAFLVEIESGKVKQVEIPQEIDLSAEEIIMHENNAYFYEVEGNNWEVLKWNVLTNEVDTIVIKDGQVSKNNQGFFNQVIDGKLFLLNRQLESGELANLAVIDLATDAVDYVGRIEVNSKNTSDYLVTFYWLTKTK